MNEDCWHPQWLSYRACMLTSCSTKTGQDMISSVVSSALSQTPDRSTHGLISNSNETHGYFLNTKVNILAVTTLGGQEFIYLKVNERIYSTFLQWSTLRGINGLLTKVYHE